jgi:CRP/FNR family transcriptional regulator
MALNRRMADMTGSVEIRIGRLFSTLAERVGQKTKDGIFIPIALSRQDIADLVGTTVETAIRILSRWQKEGIVETDKKGFRISDLSLLGSPLEED